MSICLVSVNWTDTISATTHTTLISNHSDECWVASHYLFQTGELNVTSFFIQIVFFLENEKTVVNDIQIKLNFTQYIHWLLVHIIALVKQPLWIYNFVIIHITQFTITQLTCINCMLVFFIAFTALLLKLLFPVQTATEYLLD